MEVELIDTKGPEEPHGREFTKDILDVSVTLSSYYLNNNNNNLPLLVTLWWQ